MKTLTLFLAISLTAILAKAQDLIVKTDRTELKTKVVELTEDVIKYKKADFIDGPTYSIKKVEVFMIIYQNGKKEYIESQAIPSKAPVPVTYAQTNVPARPAAVTTPAAPVKSQAEMTEDSLNLVKGDNWIMSVAFDDSFNSFDYEINKKITNQLYIGLSAYNAFSSTPSSGGIYPFLAYKQPLTADKKLYVWGNAGLNYSYVSSYSVGRTTIPSASSTGFLWEVGADYFFSKDFGITVYSPQGNNFWFGIVVKGRKLW